MFARLTAWLRRRRTQPPDDLDTPEELEAREEGRRLQEDRDTYRALGSRGPDMPSSARRGPGGSAALGSRPAPLNAVFQRPPPAGPLVGGNRPLRRATELSLTADTYTHVLVDGREVNLSELLAL